MKRCAILFLSLLIAFGLTGCGGGSGGGSVSTSSAVNGSAVKGPIEGAEIRLFFFDSAGDEVEIFAINTPVVTGPDGSYSFMVEPSDLTEITSPLIVRTVGGTMGDPPAPAPTLEAGIADPTLLTYARNIVSSNLSTATSVAAGLLKKQAQETGFPPSINDADFYIAQVEGEFGVDLEQDPVNRATGVAMVNESVDQNVDLVNTPNNNPAVNEYIDYLVANLSSSSGALDDKMDDPNNPGADIPANFAPFGVGKLAALVPNGPSDFRNLMLTTDKAFMENDGLDFAILIAALTDACGRPISEVSAVDVRITSGRGTLEDIVRNAATGKVEMTLTSRAVGKVVVEASYALPNGNIITQELVIAVVDMEVDTDGDGFPDGAETIGWEIVIDELGYGAEGGGKLLTRRWVTSDPKKYDTDGDGLNDYEEYLIRSDPRSDDTDGDGLTDYWEWTRWQTNPLSVDSDADARGPNHDLTPNPLLFDGNELTMVGTSPTLDDTDGDSRTDCEEIDHPIRTPLVAELPKLNVKIVDEVDIRLDVEFAEEEGRSRQYGTELSTSTMETKSHYTSHSVSWSLMFGTETKAGLFSGIGATYKTEFTFGTEHTYAFTAESSKTSQQAYSEYTTDSRTRTETTATGSMTMGIQLENPGNITYTLTHLGFTVRQWQPGSDPADPEKSGSFKTFATLTPALGGGTTLAPGATTSVLQVQATDLNVSRVKEFLAHPASLYIEPASYELENAEGLNFAFLEEVTAYRTARVTIDYGEGTPEEYRVATNVARELDGSYAGVTLGKIMTSILFVPFETRPRQEIDPDAPTNERVLYSVRDTQNFVGSGDNPPRGFWVVLVASDRPQPGGVDFEDTIVKAGDQVLLMFSRDDDGDDLFAAEEQHYRTFDTGADQDGDGLTDVEEVRGEIFIDAEGNEVKCGWVVQVDGRDPYPVFADPAVADQDGDDWNDSEEKAAGTDPTLPDTDRDGLDDAVDRFPLIPAAVLYVKHDATGSNDGSSWDDAFTSLHEAIADAKTRNDINDPEGRDDVAEIWVAQGTYNPGNTPVTVEEQRKSFELIPIVGIYGGFAGYEEKRSERNPTNYAVLSGDLEGNDGTNFENYDDNNFHVVRAESRDEPGGFIGETAVLDGFIIAGGNAYGPDAADKQGGGMIVSWARPTLRNLFFRLNRAEQDGGGVHISSGEGTNLVGCIFNQNRAGRMGGGMYVDYSSPTLTDSLFQENEAKLDGPLGSGGGGALAIDGAAGSDRGVTVDGCSITLNRAFVGSGIYIHGGTHRIKKTLVTRNGIWSDSGDPASYGGGVYNQNGRVTITQCVLWKNSAFHGPSMLSYNPFNEPIYGDIRVINSSVSLNFGPSYRDFGDVCGDVRSWWNGGGLLLLGWNSGSAAVENSVFWGNQGHDYHTWMWYCPPSPSYYRKTVYPQPDWKQVYSEGSLSVRNSCIQGLQYYTGFGNIGGDPKFGDVEAGNLRLGSDSACIDFGSNLVDYDPFKPGFQALPETDLAGKARIVDGDGDEIAIVDIGAYEYQGS